MKHGTVSKKILVFVFVSVMVFASFCGSMSLNTQAASSVSTLEDKYGELEKKLEALKKEMSKTQNEKSQQLKYKSQIDAEIGIVEQQIDNLENQVIALNRQITANERLLSQKESEIKENDDLFKSRLRAMYMTGDTSALEVIFGSASFSELLQNVEYTKRIAQNDRELMEKLQADRKSIVAARETIETSKIKLESNQKTMEYKKSTLEKNYAQSQKLLISLAKEESSLRNQQIKINDEMEKIDAEIRKMLEANGSNGEFVGGQFLWPVPGYKTITSKFGWRILYGKNNWHTGIDISGANVYGKNIVAANSGTVIKAVTTYVAKQGYGKYVIIDHGGGYTTLYGHCSSLSVKVGQKVSRGEVIAQVGSTGNSTGPHLHFGIYINGKEVDPLPYL